MARTAGDIRTPTSIKWPPAGKVLARCVKAERWKSPKKGTLAVMLTFVTSDGQYEFEDPVFVTEKAMSRLNLVAQHLCAMPKSTPLPDGDKEAANQLARYILDNAVGCDAYITIDKQEETFLYENGPKVGQKGIRTRHRVAFGGYDPVDSPVQELAKDELPESELPESQPPDNDPTDDPPVDDIPF